MTASFESDAAMPAPKRTRGRSKLRPGEEYHLRVSLDSTRRRRCRRATVQRIVSCKLDAGANRHYTATSPERPEAQCERP